MLKQLTLYFLSFLILSSSAAQKVVSISIDGAINPSAAAFIKRGIVVAEEKKAECLIIYLNTPGGLLKSTRVIVSEILESPVPIVVYVYPGGAHAGSAGVFITLAANIAAMAPGTNIGAAHPVSMQGGMDSTMNEKTTNDAAAFIRSIAGKRNRNLEWAERAVLRSYSYSETEALENNVIDLVAKNVNALLDSINGRTVELSSGIKILNTKKAEVENIEMSFIEKLLAVLGDPNIAYILMLVGFYGILFELYNPGAIFPGVIGGISLILAFYSMHTLPVNYAGLALIIFSIILFILEIKIVSHGMLAIGGVISLLLGSLMLIKPGSALEFARISRGVIIPAVVVTAAFFLFMVGMGIRAQRVKNVTGADSMVGETGEAIETFENSGSVLVHGEIWRAESVGGKKIEKGQKIRVTGIEGFKLFVEQA
jgi:membrane-bound serine protease (ClpP class)